MAPGAYHHYAHSVSGPWAINTLLVDRAKCLEARAVKGFPTAEGREKTSVLLTRLDDTVNVVGGVNADFFSLRAPLGVPTNAHVSRGRALTPTNGRPVIAFDSAGSPWIGRMQDARFAPMEAVGGRPVLLRDSLIVADVDTVGGPGFATTRHPRTAVGIARSGKRLILVTVDGRQRPYSDGMTLRELATLMRSLGARDAINLDGGGSTTMVLAGKNGTLAIVNRPSDSAGERAVGNALAIVRCSRE